MKYPIIPITFFYVNGIFFSDQFLNFFSLKLIWIIIVLLITIFIICNSLIKNNRAFNYLKKVSTIIVLFLFFLMGIIFANSSKDENKFEFNDYYFGVVTIDEVLKSNNFQNRYFGQFITPSNINQKILLYQNSKIDKLKAGDRIKVILQINPVSKPKNPYQFDYSKYLERKNIFIQAKIPDEYSFISPAQDFKFKILNFRGKLMDSFQIHQFPDDVKAIIYALIFGQRADLSEKILSDYRNAGVMHILAISGLHIGILYWIINLLLKFFIRSKNLRFLFVISILICFAILSGLSGSVVRAVLMFFIVGSGLIFNRKTDTINVLVLSMFLILIINPNFLFDIGFQLSYLAVFSIVYLYPIIKNIAKSRFVILNYFRELIGISIVAQLGVLPLSVFYFGQIPLLFLLGNLIVIPVLTIVLIGLIFLLILNFVWKELSILLGKVIQVLIEFTNYMIALIASKDNFIISNLNLNIIQCIVFTILIFLIAFTVKRNSLNKIYSILMLILVLQISFFYETYKVKNTNSAQILYDYNSILVLKSINQNLLLFRSDSLNNSKSYLNEIEKKLIIKEKTSLKMQNYLEVNNLSILIVDSLGVQNISKSIDVLILKNNPDFNLERYLMKNKPRLIVFHPKNYNSNVLFWKETCFENKIPFHDMREKGYVDLNNLN